MRLNIKMQVKFYGRIGPEGKRLRKFFPLKKDADAYLGKVNVSKKEGRYHDVFDVKQESKKTFNELADEYVKNFGNQKSFSRLKYYLVQEYRATFGDRRLSEISYLDLETFRSRRRATPTMAGKPRSDATVNRELSILRHMLSKAVEWGWLEVNPFSKGSRLMVKENNHRLRFLDEPEIEALLKAAGDLPQLRPLWRRPC